MYTIEIRLTRPACEPSPRVLAERVMQAQLDRIHDAQCAGDEATVRDAHRQFCETLAMVINVHDAPPALVAR